MTDFAKLQAELKALETLCYEMPDELRADEMPELARVYKTIAITVAAARLQLMLSMGQIRKWRELDAEDAAEELAAERIYGSYSDQHRTHPL